MNLIKKTSLSCLALLAALLGGLAQADVVLVADASLALDALTPEQARRLYLARPGRFPGGLRLVPFDQPASSPARRVFVREVLKMSERELAQYWSRRTFAGKGRPPRVLADDAAVVDRVKHTPGGVGYIDADSLDDDIKVLLRIPAP